MNLGPAVSTVEVRYAGVPFQIDPAEPARPAWFVLGVRKSGSSMFNRAVRMLARFNAVNWVDIAGDLFEHDVSPLVWSTTPPPPGLIVGGNCYGGFRELPTNIAADPGFAEARKVLLVRDPRDAIVSEYFSTRSTHSLPKFAESQDESASADLLRRREAAQQITIEEFALGEAARMAETIARYIPLLADPGLLLLRYEDIIFDKAGMARAVAAHFGWTVGQGQVDAVLKWLDVVPAQEDPTAFIRKVTPGDHREKLTPATIARLDEVLGARDGTLRLQLSIGARWRSLQSRE